MDQKNVFLHSEGDQYYERNRGKLTAVEEKAARDQVLTSLRALNLKPSTVLEVGSSNGWRLQALRQEYNAKCWGIEPSAEAIRDGIQLFPEIHLQQGAADKLPFDDFSFELVILGFCLYLCDRKDLFKIAYETDRVLIDKAHCDSGFPASVSLSKPLWPLPRYVLS